MNYSASIHCIGNVLTEMLPSSGQIHHNIDMGTQCIEPANTLPNCKACLFGEHHSAIYNFLACILRYIKKPVVDPSVLEFHRHYVSAQAFTCGVEFNDNMHVTFHYTDRWFEPTTLWAQIGLCAICISNDNYKDAYISCDIVALSQYIHIYVTMRWKLWNYSVSGTS